MANALGPYYVRLNYHGPFAPHTMTIPTKNWSAGAGAGDFDTWDGGTIPAADMIEALVDVIVPFLTLDSGFDNYQIFRQLLPSDILQPVAGDAFVGKAGTGVLTGWAAAVEGIIVARTSLFGIAKLTILDMLSDNDFEPVLTPTATITALLAEWFADTNGWAGRDNGQPNVFIKQTKNLNDALRKEYHYD